MVVENVENFSGKESIFLNVGLGGVENGVIWMRRTL